MEAITSIQQLGRFGNEMWMGCINDRYLLIIMAGQEICQMWIKDQGVEKTVHGVHAPYKDTPEAHAEQLINEILDDKTPDLVQQLFGKLHQEASGPTTGPPGPPLTT